MTRTERVEVLIVGGGPAGSSLATLLAERAIDVLVVDRAIFPRPKPCGECINPGGVAALGRIGLLDAVRGTEPAALLGWTMRTDGGARAAGSYAPGTGLGLGVSRESLDAALLGAARARGVRVLEGARVGEVRRGRGDAPEAVVTYPDGSRRVIRSAVIVGADGLRSVVARRLRMVRRLPRLRKISLTCRVAGEGPSRTLGSLFLGDGRTVGLAPVHASAPLWNATVVVHAGREGRAVSSDPRALFARALRAAHFPWSQPPEVMAGPWTSGPFDWPTRRMVTDGVVLVGDAAGYYDPLSGQGLCRALRSAELAAPVVARAVRREQTRAVHLDPYHYGMRREVRPTRIVQRGVEMAIARRWSREAALRVLGRHASAGDRLIRVLGDAAPAGTLAEPRWWWSVLRGAV